MNDLAGTGRTRHERFVAQARTYFDEWRDFITPLMFRRALLKSADYDHLPRFRFMEEPAGAILRRVAGGFIGLIIPTVLAVLFALFALRRYSLTD